MDVDMEIMLCKMRLQTRGKGGRIARHKHRIAQAQRWERQLMRAEIQVVKPVPWDTGRKTSPEAVRIQHLNVGHKEIHEGIPHLTAMGRVLT